MRETTGTPSRLGRLVTRLPGDAARTLWPEDRAARVVWILAGVALALTVVVVTNTPRPTPGSSVPLAGSATSPDPTTSGAVIDAATATGSVTTSLVNGTTSTFSTTVVNRNS